MFPCFLVIFSKLKRQLKGPCHYSLIISVQLCSYLSHFWSGFNTTSHHSHYNLFFLSDCPFIFRSLYNFIGTFNSEPFEYIFILKQYLLFNSFLHNIIYQVFCRPIAAPFYSFLNPFKFQWEFLQLIIQKLVLSTMMWVY